MVLSEHQSRLLSNYYGWLQQQGVCVVPASPDADAQERLQQLADGFSMNLNLAEKYASHFRCDERELVQNFRDRCADLSRTRQIQLFVPASAVAASITESLRDAGISKVYIMLEDLSYSNGSLGSHFSPYVLGHIVEYEDAHGMRCIDLCNLATVLTTDMFLMGGSDKEGKTHTAGHFGEGMKVQINRLMVDRKLSVTYTTGNRLWSFSHKSQTHCSLSSLHLHSNCLQHAHGHPCADPNRPEETICSIQGTRATLPSMDDRQYLFLQPPQPLVESPELPPELSNYQILTGLRRWFPCIRVQDPKSEIGVEFLFDPQYHGKLYIHGILLKSVTNYLGPTLHHMGINYTGKTDMLLKFSLNRDRNSADDQGLLCKLVPKAISLLWHQGGFCLSDQLECTLAHLYLELSASSTVFSPWRYTRCVSSEQQDIKLISQLLVPMLGQSKGIPRGSKPAPFPCDEHASTAQTAELALLGYQPVEASDTLRTMWRNSGLLPSMQQLWLERRQEIEDMPDHMTTWSPADRQEGEKTLTAIAGLLADAGSDLGIEPTAASVRSIMKVVKLRSPLCYHNHVVIPFAADRTSSSGPLLVFEAEYFLSRDSLHKRMQDDGDPCVPSGGGACDGQCLLPFQLIKTMDALKKLGVSSMRLDRLFTRNVLALTGYRLESLGAQASETPAGVNDAPQEKQDVNYQPGITAKSSSKDIPKSKTVQTNVRYVQAPQVGDGDCCNFDASTAIDNYVGTSLFPGTPMPAPKVVKGKTATDRDSDSDKPLEVEVDGSSEHDLIASQVELKQGVHLYIAEGLAATPEIAATAKQLFASLETLFLHVFSTGHAAVAPQFFVYYDPQRSSIAFNRAGQLWFNAAVKVDTSGYQNTAYGVSRFWYLIVCHELAHNKIRQHNSAFSDACSGITLQFADRFNAYAQSFYGVCR